MQHEEAMTALTTLTDDQLINAFAWQMTLDATARRECWSPESDRIRTEMLSRMSRQSR